MKTFQLEGIPRVDLGKKAVKAIRKQDLIPAVLNGGEIVEMPCNKALKAGESNGRCKRRTIPSGK